MFDDSTVAPRDGPYDERVTSTSRSETAPAPAAPEAAVNERFHQSPDTVLARAAYLELILFQELSDLVSDVAGLDAKQAVGQAASEAFERNEALLARIAESSGDPTPRLGRQAELLDHFAERVRGRNTEERLLSCYLMSGFLHDLFRALVEGLPGALRAKVEPLTRDEEEQELLWKLVQASCEGDETVDDRLAMWGRRIVGDAILLVRQMFELGPETADDDREVAEAFIARLVANHTRRMSALGMAA